MFNRCMEEEKPKKFKLKAEVGELEASNNYGSPVFTVRSTTIKEPHIDNYISTLRKLQCQVNFQYVNLNENGMVCHLFLHLLEILVFSPIFLWSMLFINI